MKTDFIIRQALNEKERSQALEYGAKKTFDRYGSNPDPKHAPPDLFIAFEGNEIVGTIAIEFGKKDILLPFEKLYEFKGADLPFAYVREQTIYYSRWNSSRKNLGALLWLHASQYAISKGAIWSSAIGKEERYTLLKEKMGCIWHPIPNAKIKLENVAPNDYNYFTSEPLPIPCLAIIEEQIKTLPKIVEKLLRANQ